MRRVACDFPQSSQDAMTDRVHACLDGDLPVSALSDAEQAHLARFEASIDAVAESFRAYPVPDLVDAVMRQLPAAPTPARARSAAWRRALAWLWAPHSIQLQLRPAYGLVAAMALAVLVPRADLLVPAGPAPVAETDTAPASSPMYVQFRLDAANASSVQLVGSFTNWKPTYELNETSPGVWSVLVPLEPGVHDYGFMVDGERWVVDPKAPQVDDQFGGTNSRLSLVPPDGTA